MHTFLNPAFLISLKDYICPCDDAKDMVNYIKMFSSAEVNPRLKDFLTNTFNLIDIDHNGVISYKEAKRAVKIINKSMGSNYDISYISSMDKNDDNVVDFNEFTTGFSSAFNCQFDAKNDFTDNETENWYFQLKIEDSNYKSECLNIYSIFFILFF